jgi:hypothetical protein
VLVFLLLFLVLTIVFAIFINIKGKEIITSQIESNLKVSAKLEKVSFALPFSVKLQALQIGNFFIAQEISFFPNLAGIFAGKVVISGLKITRPEINLLMDEKGRLNLPQLPQGKNKIAVVVTSIDIADGRIILTDKKIDAQGLVTILDKLNLRASLDMLALANLKIKADLKTEICDVNLNTLGYAGFTGWLNLRQKDMHGVFNLSNLEVTHFAPYYGDFISSRKLLSGRLNLDSLLDAKNNDLTVDSKLKLFKLAYAPQESAETGLPQLNFSKNSLDLFADQEGNVSFEFAFQTKLDNLNISQKQLKNIILEAAMKNLGTQNPATLLEKIGNTVKDFKDFGKKMKAIFKGN